MRSLTRLDAWTSNDIENVFALADTYRTGSGPQLSGAAVMFFPETSLRTRVSFELGASRMGMQPIVFPSATLDKPEALFDVAKYLESWAEMIVVRHPELTVIEQLAAAQAVPVVNAMTDMNHPCEVLSDLYALRAHRDPYALQFLFVGGDGNIARAWQEAARVASLTITQCCPEELATGQMNWTDDLDTAIRSADVVLTDDAGAHANAMEEYRITAAHLDMAPPGMQFNPCPPFTRGREVTSEAISHPAFVGHQFKSSLVPVQQAIMAFCSMTR